MLAQLSTVLSLIRAFKKKHARSDNLRLTSYQINKANSFSQLRASTTKLPKGATQAQPRLTLHRPPSAIVAKRHHSARQLKFLSYQRNSERIALEDAFTGNCAFGLFLSLTMAAEQRKLLEQLMGGRSYTNLNPVQRKPKKANKDLSNNSGQPRRHRNTLT